MLGVLHWRTKTVLPITFAKGMLVAALAACVDCDSNCTSCLGWSFVIVSMQQIQKQHIGSNGLSQQDHSDTLILYQVGLGSTERNASVMHADGLLSGSGGVLHPASVCCSVLSAQPEPASASMPWLLS